MSNVLFHKAEISINECGVEVWVSNGRSLHEMNTCGTNLADSRYDQNAFNSVIEAFGYVASLGIKDQFTFFKGKSLCEITKLF